jgi:hypothetical protein
MSDDTGKPEGEPKEPEEKSKQEDEDMKAKKDAPPIQRPKEEECPAAKLLRARRKRRLLCSCDAGPLDFLDLRLRKHDKL